MIFQDHLYPQIHSKSKPKVNFNYISPKPNQTHQFVTPLKSLPIQQFSQMFRKNQEKQISLNIKQNIFSSMKRNKIFDNTYSTKKVFKQFLKSHENHTKTNSIKNIQSNKKRRNIFTRNKQRLKYTVRQSSPSYSPPSTLHHCFSGLSNSKTNKNYHIYSLKNSRNFNNSIKKSSIQQQNQTNSKINVELQDSQTSLQQKNQAITNTGDRFFDKNQIETQPKMEKLSQVNLYATIQPKQAPQVNQKFSFFSKFSFGLSKNIKLNFIPFLLVIFGFLILLVQLSK